MRDATVLIVDDEPNAIRVLSAILKSEGYNVLESLGGERVVLAISNVITVLKKWTSPEGGGCLRSRHGDR